MKKISILYFLLPLALCWTTSVIAQVAAPFANEIADFKKRDSLQAPASGGVLFLGSSSFRLWEGIEESFPGVPLINRGFGGSSLPDVIAYVEDIVFPYAPKQVVIYCGENDFASADSITPQIVFTRFTQLFGMIRNRLPGAHIAFVSIKPSPSRAHLMPKMVEANGLIRSFLEQQKQTAFVDVYALMLDKNGKPMQDIFLADKLHMNSKGYEIWRKALLPVIL